MAFKVKKVEFDCPKLSKDTRECLVTGFIEIAEILNYIPTIKLNSEIKTEESKTTIKFRRSIALNTVNNILTQLFDRQRSVKLDEIEYKPKSKKVEVEVVK